MATIVNGKRGKLYHFTCEELEQADAEMAGYCIRCGEYQDGVEPDARKYECDNCGMNAVYGAGELAIMGFVTE